MERRLDKIQSLQNTSTRTVAEIVEKRHSDVLRTITILERNIANAKMRSLWKSNTYVDEQGKPRKEYVLTKKGLLLIASKYSDELRLQIIERLEYLEEERKKLMREQKRTMELELSFFWNKSDREDLYG